MLSALTRGKGINCGGCGPVKDVFGRASNYDPEIMSVTEAHKQAENELPSKTNVTAKPGTPPKLLGMTNFE